MSKTTVVFEKCIEKGFYPQVEIRKTEKGDIMMAVVNINWLSLERIPLEQSFEVSNALVGLHGCMLAEDTEDLAYWMQQRIASPARLVAQINDDEIMVWDVDGWPRFLKRCVELSDEMYGFLQEFFPPLET